MNQWSWAAAFIALLASSGCSPTASNSPSPSPSSPVAMNQTCDPSTHPTKQVPGLPADAVCVTTARGNFDGTSSAESLTTYSLRGATGPIRPWYVRADLTKHRVVVVDLGNLYPDLLDVTILGATDARGDGHDLAFVALNHGASTDWRPESRPQGVRHRRVGDTRRRSDLRALAKCGAARRERIPH